MAAIADLVASTRCGNLSVEIEDRPRLLAPRLARVMVEIAELTRVGPSFLILSQGSQDYWQTAGGGDAYVVECRQHEGTTFRHSVAGRRDGETRGRVRGKVRVPTSGGHVEVYRNERLSCADVQYLAYAFIMGPCRSRFFDWRDTTDQFL